MNDFIRYIGLASAPVHFFTFAFMIKCLLVSFYCGIIALMMHGIQKRLLHKMSVQGIYYSWYTLLLSLPLSGFGWNRWLKQPLYDCFFSPELGTVCKIAAFLWLAVAMCRAVKACLLNRKVRSAIKAMEHCTDIDVMAHQAASAVGINLKNIRLVCSDDIGSPASYGVIQKTILLPKGYLDKYTPDELFLLLLHEMFHIKNHDTAKLRILNAIQCFIWLPSTVYKGFKRDTEILCDNRVLSLRQKARNDYGDLLLKECSGRNKLNGLAFSDSYLTLQYRIQALYSHKPEHARFSMIWLLIALALVFSFAWSYFNPANWLHINNRENPQIEITLLYTDNTTGEAFSLAGEDAGFRDTWQIQDGTLQVDKMALYRVVSTMNTKGASIVGVFYKVLDNQAGNGLTADKIELAQHEAYGIHIRDLESADEHSRFFVGPLDEGNAEKEIYLAIARWL